MMLAAVHNGISRTIKTGILAAPRMSGRFTLPLAARMARRAATSSAGEPDDWRNTGAVKLPSGRTMKT